MSWRVPPFDAGWRQYQRELREDQGYAFFIFRTDDTLLGGLTVSNASGVGVSRPPRSATGCWPSAYAAGHTTHAVRCVLPFAFDVLGSHGSRPPVCRTTLPPRASRGAVGFVREGRARRYLKINGVWQDHDLFAPAAGTTCAARRISKELDVEGYQGRQAGAARGAAPAFVCFAALAALCSNRLRRQRLGHRNRSRTRADRHHGLERLHEGRGDNLRIEIRTGADGTAGPIRQAITPGTSPSWFVFALVVDRQADRALAGRADRYSAAGSGIVWPGLDARR